MFESSKVSELAGHIRSANGNVSFILGAGASVSANIPMASQLISKASEMFPHCVSRLSSSDRLNYGKVMGHLSPAEREQLIGPLLYESKINWGHIALASLLKAGYVQRVLTFNFDLILEKSASMLGVHLPVYDFGVAPSKDVNRIVKTSIVHLHGQSHGMVLLNTEEETRRHTENIRPLIADTLRNSITFVVGYSGLADSAFQVMCEEYNSYHRLIWLGYGETCPDHLNNLLDSEFAEYVGNCDFDKILIDIAKEMGSWPPLILKNPMDHTLEVLKPTSRFPTIDSVRGDFLVDIRRRLENFSVDWNNGRTAESELFDTALGVIEPTQDDENESILGITDPLNKEEVSSAYLELAKQNFPEMRTDAIRDAIPKLKKANVYFSLAAELSPSSSIIFREWGYSLTMLGIFLDGNDSYLKFNEAIEKFEISNRLNDNDAVTYTCWGIAFSQKARKIKNDEAKKLYKSAFEKFEIAEIIDDSNSSLYATWGSALVRFSTIFSKSKLRREAVLKIAEKKLLRFQELTDKTPYSLACLFAVKGENVNAMNALKSCKHDDLLPQVEFLDRDTELDSIRNDPEYIKFRSELELTVKT